MTKIRISSYWLVFSFFVFLFGAYGMIHAWITEGKNRELETKVKELQRGKNRAGHSVKKSTEVQRIVSKKPHMNPLLDLAIKVDHQLNEKKFVLGKDLPKALWDAINKESVLDVKDKEEAVHRARKEYEKNPSLVNFRTLRVQEKALEVAKGQEDKCKQGDFVLIQTYKDGREWQKTHNWDPKKGARFLGEYVRVGSKRNYYLLFQFFLPFKDYPNLVKAIRNTQEAQKLVDLGVVPWFNKKPLPKRRELAMLYLKEGWIKGDDGMAYPLSVALDFDRETWKARVKK